MIRSGMFNMWASGWCGGFAVVNAFDANWMGVVICAALAIVNFEIGRSSLENK